MRRVVGWTFAILAFVGVSAAALFWIQLSDAVGQESGRQPPWRQAWLPALLAASIGALVVGVSFAVIVAANRRRS